MSEIDKENELEAEESEQVEEVGEQPQDEDKITQLNDQYIRLMAEYDNFKKRTAKEKIDIYTSAAADVVEAILPVVDAVSRAIEIESDGEGMILIKKQLDDALKSIGVEEINAQGEQFDPEYHNAVMHIDDDSIDNNTIIEVFAKGYKYRSKVIRHSMVKVAN